MKKNIVLVENQLFYYGYNIIKKLREHGYFVTLVTRDLNLYVEPFKNNQVQNLFEANIIIKVETNSFDELKEALLKVNKEWPIECVVTFSDYYLDITSKVCEYLHLKTNSFSSIENTKNKFKQFELVKKSGVIVPETQVFNIDNTLNYDFLDDVENYPCIVKPECDNGSHFVRKINNKKELKKYIEMVSNIYTNERNQKVSRNYLMQEFIDGIEYSAEVFVENGNIHILGYTSKELYSNSIFAEKVFSFPCEELRDFSDYILENIDKIVQGLNLKYGCLHIEFKIRDNDFILIEVNPRLGGRYISRMIKETLGFDCFFETILLVIKGKDYQFPKLKPCKEGAAYNALFPPIDEKKVSELKLDNKSEIFLMHSPKSNSISDNSDAVGYIYSRQESAKDALIKVKKIECALKEGGEIYNDDKADE